MSSGIEVSDSALTKEKHAAQHLTTAKAKDLIPQHWHVERQCRRSNCLRLFRGWPLRLEYAPSKRGYIFADCQIQNEGQSCYYG